MKRCMVCGKLIWLWQGRNYISIRRPYQDEQRVDWHRKHDSPEVLDGALLRVGVKQEEEL